MHLPPPKVAMSPLAQKLSEPLPSVKVQHLLYCASVQSEFCLQMRTFCVPVHVVPRVVGHCADEVQATVTFPFVQLGTWPPVMGMVAQQTLPEQSAGLEHTKPASPPAPESLPPEELLLPLPLLLVLPLPLPLPLPLLVLPLPLPLLPLPLLLVLLPLPPPLLVLPLLPLPLPEDAEASPVPSGVFDAVPLHAASSEARNAADARRAIFIGTSRAPRFRAKPGRRGRTARVSMRPICADLPFKATPA
jgi:hypothetical protein